MSRRPRASGDTEDGFLGRWSKRKARARQPEPDGEAGLDPREAQEEAAPEPASAGDPPAEAEPVKTDEDMPDLDSIDETTDMSDFFSPGVSEKLRNQALRRLFSMAKYNVTDGLDDYAEDFRNFAPLGDIVTADMRHRMEMEQQRQEREALARSEEPEAAPAGGETEPDAPQEAVQETAGASEDDGREEPPGDEAGADDDSNDTDDTGPPARGTPT